MKGFQLDTNICIFALRGESSIVECMKKGSAAKATGLTMVTHNVKHFERIEGLVIEDWVN